MGTVMPVVPGALSATAPLNGPEAAGNAVGFTVTCRPLEMVPEGALTVSQFPPSAVLGVAVNVVMLELLLESVNDRVSGTVLFAVKVKLSELGLEVRGLDPWEVSNSTRTEREAPPPVIFRKPSSVERLDNAGFTETVNCRGVVPLEGVTVNQLLFDTDDMARLVGPAELVIVSVCDGGAEPVKVSCGGFAASVPFWARAVSEEHTTATNRLPKHNENFREICTSSSRRIRISRIKSDAATRGRSNLPAKQLDRGGPARVSLTLR
jgi:hypothetical protein